MLVFYSIVQTVSTDKSDDLDGKPMEEEKVIPKFATSKWESVDEAELKAQGMQWLVDY